MLPGARALEAALIAGDEGGDVWLDRMNDLHEPYTRALQRVADEGRLAPGWTVEAAADWTWARVQPSTWDHLVGHRARTPDHYTERTVRSLLAELVTP